MIRRLIRRVVPFELRWRLRLAMRYAADRGSSTRFAARCIRTAPYRVSVCEYERPLICYPGQAGAYASKRRNIELALAAVDGTLIRPGETFSFWRLIGRPTKAAGYGRAAALKAGVLTEDIGGALCLVSTLLYNVALNGGMEIVERRCHSVDSYGPRRYFELGRDATVEYAYVDLRFRNPHAQPIMLRTHSMDSAVRAELLTATPIDLRVELNASAPIFVEGRLGVRVDRRVVRAGAESVDVTWSWHRAPWLPDADSPQQDAIDSMRLVQE